MKVILIGAMTICGRIGPVVAGSRLDRRRLEAARDNTQASLLGANTLRVGDPEMRGTGGRLQPERFRAIISKSGSIPIEGKKLFIQGPKPVVFTSADNTEVLLKKMGDMAQVIALPEGPHGLSLQTAADFLSDKGVESLLIEGGGRLNYSALAQGMVDEILLTILPVVAGDRNAPAFIDGPESIGKPFLEFELISCEPVSTGEVFLHYRNKRTN